MRSNIRVSEISHSLTRSYDYKPGDKVTKVREKICISQNVCYTQLSRALSIVRLVRRELQTLFKPSVRTMLTKIYYIFTKCPDHFK